jgi:hypothetical protein
MKGAAAAPFIFEERESLGLREPAAPALGDLAFTFKARKHAVEIVLLYPHLRCQLRDRDARLSLHQAERFDCPRSAAFSPSRPAASGRAGRFAFWFCRRPRFFRGGGAGGGGAFFTRTAGTPGAFAAGYRSGDAGTCRAAHAGQGGQCCLQPTVLVHGRLKFFKSISYLAVLLVKEVVHVLSSSLVWLGIRAISSPYTSSPVRSLVACRRVDARACVWPHDQAFLPPARDSLLRQAVQAERGTRCGSQIASRRSPR